MPRDFALKLAATGVIPKRLFRVVSAYIFFLGLRCKRHSLRNASLVGKVDESRFSSFLGSENAVGLSQHLFQELINRHGKRALKATKGRLTFIIDTTFQQRHSQVLENIHRYHTGTRFITAHKIINVVVWTRQGVLPLAAISVYTKKYCRQLHLPYVSEYELAARWIDDFAASQLLSASRIRKAVFLLDAGFDTRRIQNAIRHLGAHFVVALKCLRVISGQNVAKYFRRHRHLAWSTIRIMSGSGNKKHGRKYSFRTATGVNLKGVGPATVLWSKAHGHARKPKYLAASDLTMKPRDIIRWYALRWTIELWHRDMKQHHGYGDCHCRKFSAVEAHIHLSLCAYLISQDTQSETLSLERYLRKRDLEKLHDELPRFSSVTRLKTLIQQAWEELAA